MPSCPECEYELDIELDEVEEGDVVACAECGSEYEVVGVEPLELARVVPVAGRPEGLRTSGSSPRTPRSNVG